MNRGDEGSTRRLLQLCGGYFTTYVLTGLIVKYFTGSASDGFPGMHELQFLVYNTLGATTVCLSFVLVLGWYRLQSQRLITVGPLRIPSEYLYIIPSGVCTAVVIPTTTLMYTLPISVMVAMVIMRAAVIVISRVVDALQIAQGILEKKVYWQENAAVGFALVAVGVNLFWGNGQGGFDFLESGAAMAILSSYITAYLIRIYIMNYYKNTRAKAGVRLDNNGFFAIEQIAASVALAGIAAFVYYAPLGDAPQLALYKGAIASPPPGAWGAAIAGLAYGLVAFFSVFIFMFKGRTATFAGLVNRLTSLVAGTTATLLFAVFFGGKLPKIQDWASLGFILVAVAFLAVAERRRAAELAQAAPSSPVPVASTPALARSLETPSK